jgi:hypothetical protein
MDPARRPQRRARPFARMPPSPGRGGPFTMRVPRSSASRARSVCAMRSSSVHRTSVRCLSCGTAYTTRGRSSFQAAFGKLEAAPSLPPPARRLIPNQRP